MQQAKDESSAGKTDSENWIKIDNYFKAEYAKLQDRLTNWQTLYPNGEEQRDDIEKYFEESFTLLDALREHIQNFSYALPVALFGDCQNKFESYKTDLLKAKEVALPKKKFSFAKRAKKVKKVEEKKQETTEPQKNALLMGNHLSIKELKDQEIRKTEEEYKDKENVIIENLENCRVFLPFVIKSVYIKDIKNCKLFIGAVSGPTFVNEAIDCDINTCSHQIRIHNSKNTQFNLIARSNPIIEHCSEMRFGLYHCTYPEHEEHLK